MEPIPYRSEPFRRRGRSRTCGGGCRRRPAAKRILMIGLAALPLLAAAAPALRADAPVPENPMQPPDRFVPAVAPPAPATPPAPGAALPGSGSQAEQREPAELRTDSAVRELRSLENRLILDAGAFRFLLMDIRDRESVYTAAGIAHPLLSAGPVRREGLLGRLYRPLRIRAFSAAWEEESGLALETGFSRAPAGAAVRLLPGTFSFFGLLPEDAPAAGLSLSLGRGRPPEDGDSRSRGAEGGVSVMLTGLHSLPSREPPREALQESWFRDDAPFPGGSLTTGAGELAVRGRILSLAASGAISRGERILPGWLVEGRAAAEGGRMRIGAAAGFADPRFRSPDGEPSTRLALAGGELLLFPEGPLALEAGVYRTLRRGDVRDDFSGARELDLNASASTGSGPVRITLEGRRKLIEEPRKEPEREGRASLGFAFDGELAEAALRLSLLETDGTCAGWEASAGGGLSDGRISADFDAGVERRTDRLRFTAASTLRRRGGKGSGPDLFFRIETRRPLDLFTSPEDGDEGNDGDDRLPGFLTVSAGIGMRTAIPRSAR